MISLSTGHFGHPTGSDKYLPEVHDHNNIISTRPLKIKCLQNILKTTPVYSGTLR